MQTTVVALTLQNVLRCKNSSGFLDQREVDTFLGAFGGIALDVVCCSLTISDAVLGRDGTYDETVLSMSDICIQRYLKHVARQLGIFCARDQGKYYSAEFIRWAEAVRRPFQFAAHCGTGLHYQQCTTQWCI